MAGPTTISNTVVRTFERNVRFLAQQQVNRLRPFVSEKSEEGGSHVWELLSKAEATEKTTRAQATPSTAYEFSNRVSLAKTWNAGYLVEQEDPTKTLIDLNGSITQAMGFSMRRAYDAAIITALGGASLDADGNSIAYTAGQLIGDGTLPITFDYVTQVQEKFMENDITPDVPKCFVVGPTQIRQLMQTTEATSDDYVRGALNQLSATGIVPNWMGFNWICSTLLQAPAGGQLDCYAFTKQGVGLQVNKDISVNIAQDPSRSFAWSLYCWAVFGATRVEDAQVVKLRVAN